MARLCAENSQGVGGRLGFPLVADGKLGTLSREQVRGLFAHRVPLPRSDGRGRPALEFA
jgi:hypothetical protein